MNTLLLFFLSIALCLAGSSYDQAPTNPPYDKPDSNEPEPQEPDYDDCDEHEEPEEPNYAEPEESESEPEEAEEPDYAEPEEAEEPEPEEAEQPDYAEPEEAEEPEPEAEQPSYGQETENPTMAPANQPYSAPATGSTAPKVPDGSCSKGQWQCGSVTKDDNFVKCLDGKCICRVDQGFSGSATVADPCVCGADRSVYWADNNAYCLNASQVAHCASNQYSGGTNPAGTKKCAQQWECEVVSMDYNFVACLATSGSKYCQCDRRAGFTGAATIASPCKCQSPKKVVWIVNKPYCLDVSTCNTQSN